jgi:hypothetical protein
VIPVTGRRVLISSLALLAACAAPAPTVPQARIAGSGLERLWIEAFGLE